MKAERRLRPSHPICEDIWTSLVYKTSWKPKGVWDYITDPFSGSLRVQNVMKAERRLRPLVVGDVKFESPSGYKTSWKPKGVWDLQYPWKSCSNSNGSTKRHESRKAFETRQSILWEVELEVVQNVMKAERRLRHWFIHFLSFLNCCTKRHESRKAFETTNFEIDIWSW